MTSFPSTSSSRDRTAQRGSVRLLVPFRLALRLIRRHLRAYLLLNGAALLAFSVGAVAVALDPGLQHATTGAATQQLSGSPVGMWVVSAYQSGDVPVAAALTFAVNLLLGSVLTMTLPSLLVPGFSVAFLLWRMFQWGVIFPPFGADAIGLLPHDITLLVEGQAYVLVALAAWIAARKLLQPRRFGLRSRRSAWVSGLRDTLQMYPLVAAILVVAAVYEALEVVYLVP